jgi:predicted TIM-barrel fold metal-dependent hydrolase
MKLLSFCMVAAFAACAVLTAGSQQATVAHDKQPPIHSFASVDPIDAHIHIYKQSAALSAFLNHNRLHLIDIVVIDDRDPFYKDFQAQLTEAEEVVRSSNAHASLCTTFSPYDFEEPGFSQRVIRQLDENFADGAIAVKIYKTLGLEIRNKNGMYLTADDPVFKPIYEDIAAHNRTVIAHLAEPTSSWQAPNPSSLDYEYYKGHPGEYAYTHPEWPTKEAILAARDRLLEENPKLRVVGAHLGSMELDVDEIAKRFDRYPNFAVDTAARVPYLMLQPRGKVRDFLIKYQDRVLYGTDFEMMPNTDVKKGLAMLENIYAQDWKYFATDETFEYKGRKVTGLKLPASVLRKLYHDNAVQWFPGILAKQSSEASGN